MASVNKVILIGTAGKDPEIRYTNSGTAICNVSIATNRKWTDKASGEKREETEWHSLQFFDKLAEIAGEYIKKGRSVYVEGRLKTRKWEDKNGVERYNTDVICDSMQVLGARDDGHQSAAPSKPAARPAQSRPMPQQSNTGTGFDSMDDDIPF